MPRPMSPKVVVSVVYVVAMFMAIMDTTIVNVALPTISTGAGHATPETGDAFNKTLEAFIQTAR
jgi:hypothetical protein